MKRIQCIGTLVVVLALTLIANGFALAADYRIQGKPIDFSQEFDFGGQTVTFVGHYDMLAWDESASLTDRMSSVNPARVKEAEEKFNCKIESLVVPHNEVAATRMARLLSGESAYDIWIGIGTAGFEGMVGQQIFFPISDIVPQDYWDALPAMHYALAKTLNYKGKIYGFGAAGSGLVNISLVSYNKDIFDREGLPDPYELYENGEWTWEAMRDIAAQATSDLDGDGTTDQYGLAAIGSHDALGRFAYANNGSFAEFDEGGRLAFKFDEPNALESLRFFKELSDLKVMAPSGDPITQFVNGQAAMDLGFMLWYMLSPYLNMEDEFGLVPVPMGPAANDYTFVPRDGESMVLPANSEQPLGLVALVDFLWPSERLTDDYFDTIFMDMSPSREVFEVLKRAHSEWDGTYQRVWVQCAQNGLWDAVGQVVNEGKTPAAAIEEVKPRIQAVIDELYRQ